MHLDTNILIIIVVAILSAPLTMLTAALRDRIRAAPAKLAAEVATIKNPTVRTLATEVADEAPIVLAVAEKSLAASRNHIVAEVSRINPDIGSFVGSLIDTALAKPPTPGLPPAPVLQTEVAS